MLFTSAARITKKKGKERQRAERELEPLTALNYKLHS